MRKIICVTAVIFGFLWGGSNFLQAQNIIPGFRIGTYTDAGDLFIGGEILVPVSRNIWFNPNIEYVFIEGGDYITFNGDFHYDFYLEDSPLFFWVGAGLGILYFSPEGRGNDNTDAGFNILFGTGLETQSRIIPYAQAKVIVSDNTEFVIGLGIRF